MKHSNKARLHLPKNQHDRLTLSLSASLCLRLLSYPAVNRYSSSSLSSQASNEVSNITGQSESSDEVFNMQVISHTHIHPSPGAFSTPSQKLLGSR